MYEPCEQYCNQFGCFLNYWKVRDRHIGCEWEYSQKLQAADRRPRQHFGQSVTYDESTGTAVVGARFTRTVDHFNMDASGSTDWFGYKDHKTSGGYDDDRSGAVYVFSRQPELRSSLGLLLKEPTWNVTEHIKLTAHDAHERMAFGAAGSVSMFGYTLVVGAPNDVDGGSFHFYDLEYQRMMIPHRLYTVHEGQNEGIPFVEVNVLRDRFYDHSRPISIGWALSDITAVGVNQNIWDRCHGHTIFHRRPQFCGDYLLQSGEMHFAAGEFERKVRVNVANDFCFERYSEYVKFQLFIPGGPPLIGEKYTAVVRIDDDDIGRMPNRLNVDYCSPNEGMGETEQFYRAHAP